MWKRLTVIIGLLIAAAATPAAAQTEKPVAVNFGFGWTFIGTALKNDFNSGWNGNLGATYNFSQKLGLQGEYMYTHNNGPAKTINISLAPDLPPTSTGLIESNHQMHVGDFDLVYRPTGGEDRPIGGYVLGGGGVYHRIIQLTTPSVGYTSICDPYWYVCYPALVSVDRIIGDRSSTDFGIDIGGGLTFGRTTKFYIETRYHYVWGQKITPTASQLPAGTDASTSGTCASGCSTNASYMPLTFGIRW